jgi:hypothetical protein
MKSTASVFMIVFRQPRAAFAFVSRPAAQFRGVIIKLFLSKLVVAIWEFLFWFFLQKAKKVTWCSIFCSTCVHFVYACMRCMHAVRSRRKIFYITGVVFFVFFRHSQPTTYPCSLTHCMIALLHLLPLLVYILLLLGRRAGASHFDRAFCFDFLLLLLTSRLGVESTAM